jgi:hypothetical protein
MYKQTSTTRVGREGGGSHLHKGEDTKNLRATISSSFRLRITGVLDFVHRPVF